MGVEVMKAFLWTVLFLCAIESLGKASWIAKSHYPERTPGQTVFDLVVGILLAVWAAWCLFGGAA